MRVRNEEQFQAKKEELMEKCFECYADYGLSSVGVRGLAKACCVSPSVLYTYFDSVDDLIVQSTEYCMAKVEDDFMAKAPTCPEEALRYVQEIPYWTAREHGKKYRLMYQVYTHPKYMEQGRRFFEGVDRRYAEYAKILEPKLGIPQQDILGMTLILVRASVHYALFEDEVYLKFQISILLKSVRYFLEKGANNVEHEERDAEWLCEKSVSLLGNVV